MANGNNLRKQRGKGDSGGPELADGGIEGGLGPLIEKPLGRPSAGELERGYLTVPETDTTGETPRGKWKSGFLKRSNGFDR